MLLLFADILMPSKVGFLVILLPHVSVVQSDVMTTVIDG